MLFFASVRGARRRTIRLLANDAGQACQSGARCYAKSKPRTDAAGGPHAKGRPCLAGEVCASKQVPAAFSLRRDLRARSTPLPCQPSPCLADASARQAAGDSPGLRWQERGGALATARRQKICRKSTTSLHAPSLCSAWPARSASSLCRDCPRVASTLASLSSSRHACAARKPCPASAPACRRTRHPPRLAPQMRTETTRRNALEAEFHLWPRRTRQPPICIRRTTRTWRSGAPGTSDLRISIPAWPLQPAFSPPSPFLACLKPACLRPCRQEGRALEASPVRRVPFLCSRCPSISDATARSDKPARRTGQPADGRSARPESRASRDSQGS